MKMLYSGRNLNFSYKLGDVQVSALRGLNIDIPHGAFLALSGPSGSGKSTLLNLLGLIENLQDGELSFDGVELRSRPEKEKNQIRRQKIGFIFQSFHLFDFLDASENVEYFLHKQGLGSTERRARSEQALRNVGLWEHRTKKPLQMSGGQRQRVAIARALAKRPQIVLADEPTASLDQGTGREVMQILKDQNQKQGVTVIVSSHDSMVLSFMPEVLKLIDGRLTDAPVH